MTHSRLWLLLLLFIAVLHRANGENMNDWCRHISPTTSQSDWERQKIMPLAESFFDYNLCKDGLQWICYIPGHCVGQKDNQLRDQTDPTIIAQCGVVLAIQPRAKNKWRVIMQTNHVEGSRNSMQFRVRCKPDFECKLDPAGKVFAKERIERDRAVAYSDFSGRSVGKQLMCEFTIKPKNDREFMQDGNGKFEYSGMAAPNKLGKDYGLYKVALAYYAEEACAKCTFNVEQSLPESGNVDFKPVNLDRPQFACPPGYHLRWRERGEQQFTTAKEMKCAVSIDVDGELRSAMLQVHCAQKKCKKCVAPTCTRPDKCPQPTPGDDFESCAQLKCADANDGFRFGGRIHTGDAVCADDGRWMVGGAEVRDVECAQIACAEVRTIVKTEEEEKFNISVAAVACMSESDVIGYSGKGKAEVLLKEVVCNFTNGLWYEAPQTREGDIWIASDPRPYENGTLRCNAYATEQAAKGSVYLYTGIALAIVAAIIGTLLIICFFLERKKKKARESALKHNLANKFSQSKESNTVSKESKTRSGVSSDRSVTGARGKKKSAPAIPDESTTPKKPEERSKPTTRSSITKTDELKRLLEEEEKKKTALATAALLESSKVGEEDEQPEKGNPTPIPDPEQKKNRPKKSSITEMNRTPELGQQNEAPTQIPSNPDPVTSLLVAKTQMGGPQDDDDDEQEQPLWNNQPEPAAAPPAAAAAAAADPQQVEMKTSREKERDAKVADLPTAKKKASVRKIKSNTQTPVGKEPPKKIVRPNFLNDTPTEWSSSSKKRPMTKKNWAQTGVSADAPLPTPEAAAPPPAKSATDTEETNN